MSSRLSTMLSPTVLMNKLSGITSSRAVGIKGKKTQAVIDLKAIAGDKINKVGDGNKVVITQKQLSEILSASFRISKSTVTQEVSDKVMHRHAITGETNNGIPEPAKTIVKTKDVRVDADYQLVIHEPSNLLLLIPHPTPKAGLFGGRDLTIKVMSREAAPSEQNAIITSFKSYASNRVNVGNFTTRYQDFIQKDLSTLKQEASARNNSNSR